MEQADLKGGKHKASLRGGVFADGDAGLIYVWAECDCGWRSDPAAEWCGRDTPAKPRARELGEALRDAHMKAVA